MTEFSRRAKLNNAQTVLYEIDMLRFAKERLLSPPPGSVEADQWVYLEDFLLHFRNLIEFFGKPPIRDSDLSIGRPEVIWRGVVPDKANLDFMTRTDLWRKYDAHGNANSISKYLSHCTTHRTAAKRWKVQQMYEDLRPVIEKFESLLPAFKPATGARRAAKEFILEGNSTMSNY